MLTPHPRTLVAVCLLGLAACLNACAAKPPEPAMAAKTQSVKAKVISVDTEERLLVLQGDGEPVAVEVPASVRRLDDIKAGDEVAVTYYEGVAAVFAPKTKREGGDDKDDVLLQAGAATAPKAAPPGRAVGRTVTARVTIKSVDRDFNTVTFTGPRGVTRVVGVNDPKMQAFAAQLKPGDEVDLTYFEALAAQVIPAQ